MILFKEWFAIGGVTLLLISYHITSIRSAKTQQYQKDQIAYAEERKLWHEQTQKSLDEQAATQNKVLQEKLTQMHEDFTKLTVAKPIEKVFRADCIAPPDKVTNVNSVR